MLLFWIGERDSSWFCWDSCCWAAAAAAAASWRRRKYLRSNESSEGERIRRERGSHTGLVDLVSWAGTHRYMGCLVRCNAYKLAWDPQGSRVHIGPCEPCKHHSLENTSDLWHAALRSQTRGDMKETNRTLGLTPVCVGKDGEKSAKGIQGGRRGRTLENQSGVGAQGVKTGAREMVEEEDKQDMTGDRS